MPRSILSASLVRPAWQCGSFRVEGPDEDAFTLGLESLQQLGRQVQGEGVLALKRLHLVGPFPSESEWMFGEALGIPTLEVRRHPASASGLWGALAAASRDEDSPGQEAVVASQLAPQRTEVSGPPRVSQGAAGVALLLGREPGLAILRYAFQSHAPGRTPTIQRLVADWLADLEVPSEGTGGIVLSTDGELAQWRSVWGAAAPGISLAPVEPPPTSEGSPSAVRSAELLWELARRLRTGNFGIVAEALRTRSGFAGFRLNGPVRWAGTWGAIDPGLRPPSERFFDRSPAVNAVSQGAYVPHPRYLENLPGRWRLVGERCSRCRALTFPPSGRCRSCGQSDGLRAEAQPRQNLPVEGVTTIGAGAQPTEFDFLVETAGSYDVAIVGLAPGVRATVQVTDALPGQLRIGDRVRLVLRRLYAMEGEWRYGLKAVPGRTASEGPLAAEPVTGPSRRRASSGVPKPSRSIPRRRGARAGSPRRREGGGTSPPGLFRSRR